MYDWSSVRKRTRKQPTVCAVRQTAVNFPLNRIISAKENENCHRYQSCSSTTYCVEAPSLTLPDVETVGLYTHLTGWQAPWRFYAR